MRIPSPDGSAWLQGRPEEQKDRIFDAVIEWLAARSAGSPLVFLVEDFHWADPSTVELLENIPRALGAAPVLLVLVQRPDGPSPDWLRRDDIETLTLEPLTRAQSALLIEQSSAGISSDNVREILTRADGIPLFVQELTRLVAILFYDIIRGASSALGSIRPMALAVLRLISSSNLVG